MTDEDRKHLAFTYEKSWYQSKKFIAFLLMELLLSAMAMVALFTQRNLGWPLAAFMTGIVMTMGAIALVFNGFQAKLDMYVRALALTGQAPRSVMEKLFGTVDKPKAKDPDEAGEDEEEI